MQVRGVPAPALFALVLTLLSRPSAPLLAQGPQSAGALFVHGRPLSEWIAQTSHYIPELRREAVKAIAALGPGGRTALPALIRGVRDENEDVRFWSVEAIRRLGPAGREAIPALLVVLSDDTRRVQQTARLALEAIGPASAEALVPALHARDAWIRANTAEALGVIGVGKGPVVAGLSSLLQDDSLWVRASAAWALGHLGPDARRSAKPLAAALREELRRDPSMTDPAGRVRVTNLTYALGRLGRQASDAAPLIVSVLYDGDDSLRTVAGDALAGIGSKAAASLGKAVRQGSRPIQLAAARSLRLLGPDGKGAIGDLVKLLESTDELEGGHDLLLATADALGAMGKPAGKALKVLERRRKESVSTDVVAALDRAIRKIRLGS